MDIVRTVSRLDFLAKTLALLGLGVLGVSAALLDRWTAALPTVSRPAVDAGAAAVQTALTLPEPAPGTLAPPAKARRFAGTIASERKDDTAPVEITPKASDDVAATTVAHLPMPVDAGPFVGSAVTLADLPPVVDTRPPTALPPTAPTERLDQGFVSGVLKRTGSSVSNSLGKASNSMLGAARLVGDAVKRAF
jgi:hypothetical protein